jgi:hypothetical protein
MEINPPLWFWLAAGLQGLAGPAGLSSFDALLLIFAAATLAAALFGLGLPEVLPPVGLRCGAAAVPVSHLLLLAWPARAVRFSCVIAAAPARRAAR